MHNGALYLSVRIICVQNYTAGVVVGIKYVLIFSTNFILNISHSKKNCARYDHKCVLVYIWSTVILVRY